MGDSSHRDGRAFLGGAESQGTEQAAASLVIHHDTDPALFTSARPSSTQEFPQLQGCKINSLLGHVLRQGEQGNIDCMYTGRSCLWHDAAKLSGDELHLPRFWLKAVVCRCGDSVLGAHETWARLASQEHTLQGDILRCRLQPLQMGENSLQFQA